MAIDLIHQVHQATTRARHRSVHLDKGIASLTAIISPEPVASPRKPPRRISSLPLSQENLNPSNIDLQTPATIRHYRSMLDVDDPPKLSPWQPMSFDELYASPIREVAQAEQPRQANTNNALSGGLSGATITQQSAQSPSQDLLPPLQLQRNSLTMILIEPLLTLLNRFW